MAKLNTKSLVLFVASVSVTALIAATAANAGTKGTSLDPSAANVPVNVTIPPKATPFAGGINVFTAGQYSTGGVALRNRATAGLNISGVVPPLKVGGAFLYWAVIVNDAVDPAGVQSIMLRRKFPLPATADVTLPGTLIGQGPSPCWGGNHISVYQASVPDSIASGDGSYQVTILPSGVGRTDGADPWASASVFPLWEGASMVMVGTGARTVVVYDAGWVSGKTFSGTLNYSLPVFGPATSGPKTWDTFGADGQVGASRSATAALSGEKTFINGRQVSGPGAPDSDSDWNGNSGAPLPQLWDNTGHDISAAVVINSAPTTLNIQIQSFGDCLTTVGNVIQF